MNMRHIYIISILTIAMIGLGCIDKQSENVPKTNILTQKNIGTSVSTPTVTVVPTETSASAMTISANSSGIDTSKDISENTPTSDVTDTPTSDVTDTPTSDVTDTPASDVTDVPTNDVTDTPVSNVTDVPTNDTSVTEIFKIGDQKNMLGVNIKLINITDYNNNTAIIGIDGVEYKYDSETTIQAKGIEIIDMTSSEDDRIAEITVDYVAP